jgi:hypothetical protein
MSKVVRVCYVAREDATPESEAHALAAVYRFVLLQAQERKNKGARPGAPNDVRRDQSAHTAKAILP